MRVQSGAFTVIGAAIGTASGGIVTLNADGNAATSGIE